MNRRFFKRGTLSSALALLMVLCAVVSAHAAAAGGGKKPPSSANPEILFRVGSDLVVADKNGANQTIVYRNLPNPNYASWCSQDGTDIIFQHEINGQPGVYRLPIIDISSGSRTVRVGTPQLVAKIPFTNPWVSARCSPGPINGQIKVVYEAQPADIFGNPLPRTDLYLANVMADGSEDSTPITILRGNENETEPLSLSSPSWSPLGDRIAFSSTPLGIDGLSDVEVIQLDWSSNNGPLVTTRQSLILDLGMGSPLHLRGQDGADFFWPRWSNTSDLIAVDAGPSHADINEGRQLWLIPAGSPGDAFSLAYDKVEGVVRFQPSWSPTDDQIIYVRSPRKGMCGERNGSAFEAAIGLSNVNDGSVVNPLNGSNCDEIAIVKDARFPDWWRGAQP